MLDWLPIYPARIATAVLLGASFAPYHAGAGFPVPALTSWKATYPDRIVRTVLPVAQQRSSFHDIRFAPALTAPALSWDPEYPTVLNRRRLPVADAQAVAHVPFARATELQAQPEYPDWIARQRIHPSGVPAVFFKIEGIPTSLSWQGEQPDFVWPRVSLVAAAQSFYRFNPEPVAEPVPESSSWAPSYQDRVFPTVAIQAQLRLVTVVNVDPLPNDPPPTDYTWQGGYPDQPVVLGRVRAQLPTITDPISPTSVPVDLRWLSIYPSFHVRVVARRPLVVFPVPVGEAIVVATDLRWAPSYPDLLRRALNSNDFFGFDPLSVASLLPVPPECIEWTEEALFSACFRAQSLTVSSLRNEDVTGPGLLGVSTC